MGVNNLSPVFLDYPKVRRSVSIEKMANDHKNSFSCQPVLVVDASNFIPVFYSSQESPLECIYGGQWIQFMAVLREFVMKFESKGIKLVFIFDGTLCKEKMSQWVEARMWEYKEIADIFDKISKNLQKEVISSQRLPSDLKKLGKFALKELDVEMYQTDTEVDADKYIASYTNKNRDVFAILSDDTDFVIFETKPVLSISRLQLQKLETALYDREVLAEHLGISTKQLPLFACLMGNDYVPYPKLKSFHQNLTKDEKGPKDVPRSISRLIKNCQWTGDVTNKEEMVCISKAVFGCENKSDLIRSGLKFYVIDDKAPTLTFYERMNNDFEKEAHDRHFTCSNTCIYNLLCKRVYASSEVCENQFQSAQIYRQIRERCYGLLFNCYVKRKGGKSAAVVYERCWHFKEKNQKNNLTEPEKVWPMHLRDKNQKKIENVMKIEEIWFKTSEEEKFEFFHLVLQIPMDLKLLVKLPDEQVALSCILNFLNRGRKSRPYLQPLDVAVFVAQSLWEPSPQDIQELEQPRVHARTLNLSTLFVTGIKAIAMALETCGFPAPYKYVKPWRFFDGKLFHHLHNIAMEKPSVRVLCNDKDEVITKFHKLLPIVTNNTMYDPVKFEWKNILEDYSETKKLFMK